VTNWVMKGSKVLRQDQPQKFLPSDDIRDDKTAEFRLEQVQWLPGTGNSIVLASVPRLGP
jgi:hypothetical protein